MTPTIFEVSDAGVSSSGKGEKISMTIRGLAADRLYRHQNLVGIRERAISFYMLTH
jgi:hypothetical protein